MLLIYGWISIHFQCSIIFLFQQLPITTLMTKVPNCRRKCSCQISRDGLSCAPEIGNDSDQSACAWIKVGSHEICWAMPSHFPSKKLFPGVNSSKSALHHLCYNCFYSFNHVSLGRKFLYYLFDSLFGLLLFNYTH